MVRALVTDAEGPPDTLRVWFRYELSTDPSVAGTVAMSRDRSGTFAGVLGPFPLDEVPERGGRFSVWVSASDPDGATATADPVEVALLDCEPEG